MIKEKDLELFILPLLQLLADCGADYHDFFRRLCYFRTSEDEFLKEVGPLVPPPPGFVDPAPRGRTDSIIGNMPLRRHSSLLNALFPETTLSRSATNLAGTQNNSMLDLNSKDSSSEPPVIQTSGCLEMLLGGCEKLRKDAEEEYEAHKIKMEFANENNAGVSGLEASSPSKGSKVIISPTIEVINGVVMKRRSSRPMSGYLSKKRPSQEEIKVGEEDGGDNVSTADTEEGSIVDDDELFGEWLPSDSEIKFRWQRWARQYRARILLEQAAARSQSGLEMEDLSRCKRMKKVNPKFVLRNWILDDIVNELSKMPQLQPVDPDIDKLSRQIRDIQIETAHYMENRGLKKDRKQETPASQAAGSRNASVAADSDSGDQSSDEEDDDEKPIAAVGEDDVQKSDTPKAEGAAVLEQALKIIVGDTFGHVSESTAGWVQDVDKAAAESWSGPVPKVGYRVFFCRRNQS
jgi:hypothetical protein